MGSAATRIYRSRDPAKPLIMGTLISKLPLIFIVAPRKLSQTGNSASLRALLQGLAATRAMSFDCHGPLQAN